MPHVIHKSMVVLKCDRNIESYLFPVREVTYKLLILPNVDEGDKQVHATRAGMARRATSANRA